MNLLSRGYGNDFGLKKTGLRSLKFKPGCAVVVEVVVVVVVVEAK